MASIKIKAQKKNTKEIFPFFPYNVLPLAFSLLFSVSMNNWWDLALSFTAESLQLWSMLFDCKHNIICFYIQGVILFLIFIVLHVFFSWRTSYFFF